MSLVEKAYEKFKNSKEQTKVINEKLYFQIIWSDYIDITGRKQGILSIVPSPDMPKLKNAIYQDENGNHFSFTGFHFANFAGKIPDWYLKCGLCSMEWQETKNIGKYLTIIE